jgi:hypothetical protein
MLYVLRTTLCGAHLLQTGELVTDVTLLLDDYGFGAARELVARKRAGEQVQPEPAVVAAWRGELQRAFEVLDQADARSPLPLSPAGEAELEAFLLEVRRAHW